MHFYSRILVFVEFFLLTTQVPNDKTIKYVRLRLSTERIHHKYLLLLQKTKKAENYLQQNKNEIKPHLHHESKSKSHLHKPKLSHNEPDQKSETKSYSYQENKEKSHLDHENEPKRHLHKAELLHNGPDQRNQAKSHTKSYLHHDNISKRHVHKAKLLHNKPDQKHEVKSHLHQKNKAKTHLQKLRPLHNDLVKLSAQSSPEKVLNKLPPKLKKFLVYVDLKIGAYIISWLGIVHIIMCSGTFCRMPSNAIPIIWVLATLFSVISFILFLGLMGAFPQTLAMTIWIWFTISFVAVMFVMMILLLLEAYANKNYCPIFIAAFGTLWYLLTIYFIMVVNSYRKEVSGK